MLIGLAPAAFDRNSASVRQRHHGCWGPGSDIGLDGGGSTERIAAFALVMRSPEDWPEYLGAGWVYARGVRTFPVFAALSLCVLASCRLFSCDEPIERERKELARANESVELVLYRGIKVSLRSAPLGDVNESGREVARLTRHIFETISRGTDTTTRTPPLSTVEYLKIAREFYGLRHALRETDEDQFPTILENSLALSGKQLNASKALGFYTSAHEHFALAIAWLALRQAPRSFRVYETGKIDSKALGLPFRLASHLLKGATFLSEGWPYMAEAEMTDYLDLLEGQPRSVIVALEAGSGVRKDADVVYAGLHAPGVLLRGFCRLKQGNKKHAIEDFEVFLTDAETAGLEGEAVWLVGAYVTISNGEQERAKGYLRKLHGSRIWNIDQRTLIQGATEALERRDPESSLNVLTDKVIITKLVITYVLHELSQVDWHKQLAGSESGRRILYLGDTLNAELNALRRATGKAKFDDIKDKAAQKVGRFFDRTSTTTN